jgi:hypothetical protein
MRIEVYQLGGAHVAMLHDGPLAPGLHSFPLATRGLPAGVYLITLQAAQEQVTRTMLLQ